MSEQIVETVNITIRNKSILEDNAALGDAIEEALLKFNVDSYGVVNSVAEADRSKCFIRVRYLYMEAVIDKTETIYDYYFEASVVKEVGDE